LEHRTIKRKVPGTIKAKISFLQKSFYKFVVLKDFKPQAFELLQSVSNLSEQKHDFVHGVIKSLVWKKLYFRWLNIQNNTP